MTEENCCCKAGGKLAMLSKLVVDVTVSVTGVELLMEVKVEGGTVTLLVESVIVARIMWCSAL